MKYNGGSFLDYLKEIKREETSLVLGENKDMVHRERLNINEQFELSIQANYFVYCEPRLTLDLDKYESMEMAIFEIGNNLNCINVLDHPNFRFFKRIDELRTYYDGQILACVPVDLIQDFVEFLHSNNYLFVF